MKEKPTQPDWIQKFQNHYRRYSGVLTLDFGLTVKDVGLYILLISQKWHFGKRQFSPYEIYRKLNTLPSDYSMKKFHSNFKEKSVLESLNKLESLGFLKKCKNPNRKSSGGRPAKDLYEANTIASLKNITQKRLDDTRSEMLNVIGELLNIEESFGLSSTGEDN